MSDSSEGYFSSFLGGVKNVTSTLLHAIGTQVQAKTEHEVDNFVRKKSKDIGSSAQKVFYDILYKENALNGITTSGEKVTIYKTDPQIIKTIVEKATSVNLHEHTPLVPSFVTKAALQKLDHMLVDRVGSYFNNKLEAAIHKASINAIYSAAGVAKSKTNSIFAEIEKTSPADVAILPVVKELDGMDQESSDMQKMVAYYTNQIQNTLNERVETAAAQIAEDYTAQLIDTLESTAESYIKVGISGAAIIACGFINPMLAYVAMTAIQSDNMLETPENESYLSFFAKYALSCFWNKESAKLSATQLAHDSAIQNVKKYMPSCFVPKEAEQMSISDFIAKKASDYAPSNLAYKALKTLSSLDKTQTDVQIETPITGVTPFDDYSPQLDTFPQESVSWSEWLFGSNKNTEDLQSILDPSNIDHEGEVLVLGHEGY